MTEPIMPERSHRTGFVSFLVKLADPKAKDRGALAALRRSLQDPRGVAASACPYVMPFLPETADQFEERMFFLVGALFTLHPEHQQGVSLGHIFRRINDATTEGRHGKDNPSTRARFVALLDAHADGVADHVRHAVSLARASSNNIALDWDRLLRDLRRWRDPERSVQHWLARDFWRPTQDAPSSSPTTAIAAESEAPR
jgi:CRISPR type I-E-associated protein CasB/Cse2